MKILEIMYSLSAGGAERFVVDISNELSKNSSHEVMLATIVDDSIANNKHYYNELLPSVHYKCLMCKRGLSVESIVKTNKLIQEICPDIVHMHCNTSLLYIPSLINRKVHYVYTFHNVVDKCYKLKIQKYINLVYLKYNLFQPVTISKLCQKSYVDFYHLNNAICINNGRSRPKLELLNKVANSINSFKRYSDDKIFVHIARCAPQKNQQLLFDTFLRLANEGQHFQLLIIGDGYENSEFYRLRNNPVFHFLGVKQNVGDYLSVSDFFVLSSLYEGLPLSLLEAMSLGCIPISTPVGGVPDVITDGVNGFLSRSISETDFYDVIKKAMILSDTISKEQVIKSYEANFSMKVCAAQYESLFESMLECKR